MVTSKPFSTISYNSEKFLLNVLNRLLQEQRIVFAAYVWHLPEEDEAKGHFHVYVVPAKRTFNTLQFQTELIEYVNGEKLPRRCLPCQSSKFQDWFLYCCHDSAYLASKGQFRKYHYKKDDFKVTDADFFSEQIHQIDWTKINPLGVIIEAARSGISFSQFLEQYPLPILQVRSAEFVFKQIQGGETTFRRDRFTHTPKTE